jgi:hypothetical protein
MAKHPHRLILLNKKTWKCTLDGCNFFVHLGLAHVLLGKTAICWECSEQFTVDEYALRDDMPKCFDCRPSRIEVTEPIPEPVTKQEMTPEMRKIYEEMGLLPKGGK